MTAFRDLKLRCGYVVDMSFNHDEQKIVSNIKIGGAARPIVFRDQRCPAWR